MLTSSMPVAVPSLPPLRARAQRLSDGVIEIKCTGQLRAEDAAYLPDLERIIEARHDRVSLVFDTLELESYSTEFPLSHVVLFRKYRERIHRIAVAHELKSIAFAVATIALASQTNIKGFSSVQEALRWVRSS